MSLKFVLVFAVCFFEFVLSFWDEGHMIIARIAEKKL